MKRYYSVSEPKPTIIISQPCKKVVMFHFPYDTEIQKDHLLNQNPCIEGSRC